MRIAVTAASAIVACAAVTYHAAAAHACGGCFAPPETVTSVDSHRMVISLSAEETILWDQIRYTGEPEDFVWVLPVPTPDTDIEIADPTFFDELEAQTAPRLLPPPLPPPPSCPPPPDDRSGGVVSADAGAASPDSGVDVFSEETVGPYETVVIGSEDPNALVDWLSAHDYKIAQETVPVIQHYIDAGSVFIVLRLAPEQGVSAMQPVRVSFSGYMATFPLKMVTVGAWGTVELTLWVISEQRYAATNYGTVTVNREELVWDFAARRSNYDELFRSTIDSHGRAWVTEFAAPLSQLWFSDSGEVDRATASIPYPYITRLRTDQLLEHLSDDLQLGPAEEAGGVSRTIQVDSAINEPPPPQCPDYDGDGEPDTWADYNEGRRSTVGCQVGAAPGAGLLMAAIALVLFGVARRRRRSI